MSNKNEVFEYLINQLRQQVNNSPYKQQCEDPAHEVQSLKNQLRDASAQIKELQEDNIRKSEHISHLTGQVKELHMALVEATGDVEAYKLIRKGEYGPEQSVCCKEDTQGCKHEWRVATFYGVRVSPTYCRKCGVAKPEECKHDWYFYDKGASMMCKKCGLGLKK